MKKLVLLMVLGALLAVPAVGQFVYVGSNSPSAGGTNSWPWNFPSTTGRFIQILPASALSTVSGPYKITEVAFSRASGTTGVFNAKQFQMRMSHTTVAGAPNLTFALNMDPCPINLIDTASGYTYSTPSANAWTDVRTHCDFAWDGKRNICLEIRYRGHATSGGFSCRSGSIARAWANSSTADNYVAPTALYTSTSLGLNTRLTIDRRCICLTPDTGPLGSTVPVTIFNMPGSTAFRIAASLGQGPLALAKNCNLCLDTDSVFWASVLIGPPYFNGYFGTTSTAGTATAKFVVPKIKALVGICVFHAGLAYGPNGIICCTNTDGTQIVP